MTTLIKRILVILSIVITTGLHINAQNSIIEDLNYYTDIIANAIEDNHRQRAHDSFKNAFDTWVTRPDFNVEELTKIKWISLKSPIDNRFKIMTWYVNAGKNDHRYYGYLFHDGKVTPLEEKKANQDIEFESLTTTNWLGALYYNIHTVIKDNKPHYILFGINGYDEYDNRKIVDVLTFDNEEIVFGKEIFKMSTPGSRDKIYNRLIITYSEEAMVTTNFNPDLDMIIHDNLIAVVGHVPNKEFSLLPDGSYIGWKYDGTFFNFVEKIYHQTQETPPMPKPVIGKNTDIMGKKVNTPRKKNKG